RLGDGEPPRGRLQVEPEECERDVVARARLGAESRRGAPQALSVVADQLARPLGRVRDRLAVAGERNARLELDHALERLEVVPERIWPALRVEADGGRDRIEDVIRGDQHAVAEQAELSVRVARERDRLPAVDALA